MNSGDFRLPPSEGDHFAHTTWQLFVKTFNGTLTLNVNECMTVLEIKNQVAARTGVPVDQFRLVNLDDVRTLRDYNIHRESTLHMTGRLMGGMDMSAGGGGWGDAEKRQRPRPAESDDDAAPKEVIPEEAVTAVVPQMEDYTGEDHEEDNQEGAAPEDHDTTAHNNTAHRRLPTWMPQSSTVKPTPHAVATLMAADDEEAARAAVVAESTQKLAEIRQSREAKAAELAAAIQQQPIADEQWAAADTAYQQCVSTLHRHREVLLPDILAETAELRDMRCAAQLAMLRAARDTRDETQLVADTECPQPRHGSLQSAFRTWKQALSRRTAATEALPACQASLAAAEMVLADFIGFPERFCRAEIAVCEQRVTAASAERTRCHKAKMHAASLRIQLDNLAEFEARATDTLTRATCDGFAVLRLHGSRTATTTAPQAALPRAPATVLHDMETTGAQVLRERCWQLPGPAALPAARRLFPNAQLPTAEKLCALIARTSTLHVANFSPETTAVKLGVLFRQYGECRVTMLMDRYTGQNRGYAFVKFTNIHDAQRALANLNGWRLGCMVLAVTQVEDRPVVQRADTLRVTNISPELTASVLSTLFKEYGQCKVTMPVDRNTGQPSNSACDTWQHRGYAFVKFAEVFDAQRALAHLNGFPTDPMRSAATRLAVTIAPTDSGEHEFQVDDNTWDPAAGGGGGGGAEDDNALHRTGADRFWRRGRRW